MVCSRLRSPSLRSRGSWREMCRAPWTPAVVLSGIATRDRASEGRLRVEPERAPGFDCLVGETRDRDHLHAGAADAAEHDEAGLGSDGTQRMLETRVADVDAGRGGREGRREVL